MYLETREMRWIYAHCAIIFADKATIQSVEEGESITVDGKNYIGYKVTIKSGKYETDIIAVMKDEAELLIFTRYLLVSDFNNISEEYGMLKVEGNWPEPVAVVHSGESFFKEEEEHIREILLEDEEKEIIYVHDKFIRAIEYRFRNDYHTDDTVALRNDEYGFFYIGSMGKYLPTHSCHHLAED